MTLHVEWRGNHQQLPEHEVLLIAFPGIGNIGKVAIETIRKLDGTNEVARLHPIGLPPLASLDDDGLLAPPHLSLNQTVNQDGVSILTLVGSAQPNEPSQQSMMATELMEFFKAQDVHDLLVLAGMIDAPERKETFAVASSASHRIDLEQMGVDVRRDEPRSGAIGVTALLASMGPLYGMNSTCIITTTVGSSGDILASQRMIERIDDWFNLCLTLPKEGNEWLKKKLASIAPTNTENLVGELTGSHDAFYM